MTTSASPAAMVDDLRRSGVEAGDLVALAVDPAVGAGCAPASVAFGDDLTRTFAAEVTDVTAVLRAIDTELRPRWVLWSAHSSVALVRAGVRLATCWDVTAVHRLQVGGWRTDPGRIWAHLHGLDAATLPHVEPVDLFSSLAPVDEVEEPVRRDGHLRPEWFAPDWVWTNERTRRWALLALVAARRQAAWLTQHGATRATATARSESTAELLCAELSVDGLPMDRAAAIEIIESLVGPRPRTEAEAAERAPSATSRCCSWRRRACVRPAESG